MINSKEWITANYDCWRKRRKVSLSKESFQTYLLGPEVNFPKVSVGDALIELFWQIHMIRTAFLKHMADYSDFNAVKENFEPTKKKKCNKKKTTR